MATTTSHLGLTKPTYTEKADVQAINGNMDIIDKEVAKRTNVRNLLVNSNFRADGFIASSGVRAYYGSVLCVGNHWLCNPSITTVTQQTDGMLLGNSNAQYAYISQKVRVEAGKKYTFAVYATSVSSTHRIATYNSNNSVIYTQDYANNRELLVTTFTAGEDLVSMLYYPGYTSTGGSAVIQWAALYEGDYTANTLPPYVAPDKRLEAIRCGIPLQPVNLLDNSNFLALVNQRGQETYTGQGMYTIDRWKQAYNGSKVTVADNGLTITPGTSVQGWLKQYFEKPLPTGTQVSLYVELADETIEVFSVSLPDAATYRQGKGYITGFNTTGIDLVVNAGDPAVTFRRVALYKGNYNRDTVPEYQPKENELVACQWYFQRLIKPTATGLPAIAGFGTAASSSVFVVCPLTNLMREGIPTVVSAGLELLNEKLGTYLPVSGITAYGNQGTNNVLLQVTTTGTLTAGEVYYLVGKNSSSYLDISRDL